MSIPGRHLIDVIHTGIEMNTPANRNASAASARTELLNELDLSNNDVSRGTASSDQYGLRWTFQVTPCGEPSYQARIWSDGCTDTKVQGGDWSTG